MIATVNARQTLVLWNKISMWREAATRDINVTVENHSNMSHSDIATSVTVVNPSNDKTKMPPAMTFWELCMLRCRMNNINFRSCRGIRYHRVSDLQFNEKSYTTFARFIVCARAIRKLIEIKFCTMQIGLKKKLCRVEKWMAGLCTENFCQSKKNYLETKKFYLIRKKLFTRWVLITYLIGLRSFFSQCSEWISSLMVLK